MTISASSRTWASGLTCCQVAASAPGGEGSAWWLHTIRRGLEHLDDGGPGEVRPCLEDPGDHLLTGQGPVREHHPAGLFPGEGRTAGHHGAGP